MSSPACRTCGSQDVTQIGRLPDGALFAGKLMTEPLPGGCLWRCSNCGFGFRHPLLSDSEYMRLYRGGTEEIWETDQARPDFCLVREQVDQQSAGAPIEVLDVGCYTGQLLASLPKHCRLYGIEPSLAAVSIAAQRGVEILAESVEHLTTLEKKFDVIMACDVIEHVPDPLAFLTLIGTRLRPDGRLMISTGDYDSWLWQFAGSSFWYCYYPEHISFIGRRWLSAMPSKCGLEVERLVRFNYAGGSSGPAALRRLAMTLLYTAAPACYAAVRGLFQRDGVAFAPPGCGVTKDHLLCVLRKSSG